MPQPVPNRAPRLFAAEADDTGRALPEVPRASATTARTGSKGSAAPGIAGTLAVDGVRGPRTNVGLQAWAGMAVADRDGVLGPKSIAAIQRKLGVRADGGLGPVTVKALQNLLNRYGANPKLTADGVWGRKTTLALQRYLNRYFPTGV